MGAVADLPIPETGAVAALPIPDTGPVLTAEQTDARNFSDTSGAFAKGLRGAFNSAGASVNAYLGQGALSLAERLGDSSISMGLTDFANDRLEQSKVMAEFSDSVSPDVRDVQGIKDFTTLVNYGLGKAGEGLGSTAPAIAAGVLLRRPVAGIFGTTLPQEAGGQVMTARADPTVMATKSATDILANATGVGTINAGIETLGGPSRVVKNILNPTKMVKGVVKDIGKTAVEQGAQEGAQQTVQQAGHTLLNEGRDKSADTMDTVNAVVGGAIGGAGIGTAGHIATAPVTAYQAIKSGTPTVDHVKEVFNPPEAPVNPDSVDYPDDKTTPEQVADWLDENTTKGKENLGKFWESIKDSPLGQKTKDWMENPTSSEELHAAATKAFNESTVGLQVKAIFGGFKEFLDRKKQANSTDSLMRTRVDDNILDHALERVPENISSVMTADHKIKLVDMLKTAVKQGEVPEGLIHLYGDPKVAESVVMNAASLMEAEPAEISKHFAAVAKQVEDRNVTVEDLVRNNLRPELYTNREMRDTVMKNFVPELQRYASLGAKDEKAMVQKLDAAFGDKAELVTNALDKIRQQTTSARATESAAKPDLEAQDMAPDATPKDTASFHGDARLNRVYASAEEVRAQIEDLKTEYGRRAEFRAVSDKPGEFHIVAHDAVGDETGFDASSWSRLWNAESRRQNKSGLENGTLTINRQPIDPDTHKPRVKADGTPVYAPLKSSTMSLIMEMGSRYGRNKNSDLKGSNRIGDLFFRGISQILSDPTVNKERPFTQLSYKDTVEHPSKLTGKVRNKSHPVLNFPDNMRLGKFGGKEYFWKDVKHYVLSKEDLTGVTDEAINTIRNTKRKDGSFPTRQEAVKIAAKEAQIAAEKATFDQPLLSEAPPKAGRQGPEFQNAGDNLAVEEADRFARARSANGGEEQGFLIKGAKAGPQGGAVGESPGQRTGKMLKADSSPEFTERRRPGPTIREQDDINRKGDKGNRNFAEFTGEELHPPTSAGALAVTKVELAYKKEIADRVIKNLLNGKLSTMVDRVKVATDIRALYHTLDTLHEMVPFTERNSFWQKHEGLPADPKPTDNLRQAVKKLEPVVRAKLDGMGPRPTETREQEKNRKDMEAASSRDNAEGGKNDKARNYVIYDDSKLENTHVSFSNMKVDPKQPLDPKLEQEIRDYVTKVLGPKAKVLFEAMDKSGNFAKLSGVETLRISIHALDPRGIGFHEAAHALFARLMAADPKSKIMLEQAAKSPVIMAQLRKLLADHPQALNQLENSEERVAYMYQFWAGGALTLGPKTTTLFERVKNFLKQIVAYLSASVDGPEDMVRVEQILIAFHNGELAEASTVREVLATKNKPNVIEQANAMLGPVGTAAKHVAFTAQGVVRGLKQPALDEIMDKLNPAVGAEGKERGFLGGMVNERTRLANEWTVAVGKATAPNMRLALEHLQNGTKPTDLSVKHIYDATRKMLDYLYKYQIDAGVKRRMGLDKETKAVEYEDIGFLKDYFPRVYDQAYLDSHADEFIALLKKHGAPDPKEIFTKIMRDTDSIKAGTDDMNAALMYFNPHTQKRTLVDIPMAELAPYLAKDLPGTMLSYISRSVRRAEYTKRFGNSGEKIQEALAEAVKNGLTPEGAASFNKAVEAMEGTIRPDMNRDLRKIQGGLMTYQNIRLLPLALFSNLVDPIGIMVRGGSIKDATDTYKNALKSVFTKNEPEGYDMSILIGAISAAQGDAFMSQAFGTQFIAPWQKRLNDWFFKYNGLEGWNKMNRIGATVAAEHFIIKQAVDPREHSERYLRELNLTAKEVKDAIVKQPDQSGKLVDHLDLSNAKIRDAMNMWVDGAIIRPNAAIRPIWMSDPAFMLVAHLKQYTYGVQEVLLARLAHEAKNGNTTPMLAMASMVPVMVAADMARVILTPSGDDDSRKASWGFFDWIFNGMQRIGLFGIGQYAIELGSKGNNATYIMGPTVNQIAGAFHQNLSTTLAKAIPGAAIFDRDLLIPQD